MVLEIFSFMCMSIKYFRHIVQTFKRLTRGLFHKIIPLWRGIAWDESELSPYPRCARINGFNPEKVNCL